MGAGKDVSHGEPGLQGRGGATPKESRPQNDANPHLCRLCPLSASRCCPPGELGLSQARARPGMQGTAAALGCAPRLADNGQGKGMFLGSLDAPSARCPSLEQPHVHPVQHPPQLAARRAQRDVPSDPRGAQCPPRLGTVGTVGTACPSRCFAKDVSHSHGRGRRKFPLPRCSESPSTLSSSSSSTPRCFLGASRSLSPAPVALHRRTPTLGPGPS